MEGFFNELYQGTPKACDLARFLEKAGKSLENNRLSLDDIRSLMDQLKEEVRRLLCCTSSRNGYNTLITLS